MEIEIWDASRTKKVPQLLELRKGMHGEKEKRKRTGKQCRIMARAHTQTHAHTGKSDEENPSHVPAVPSNKRFGINAAQRDHDSRKRRSKIMAHRHAPRHTQPAQRHRHRNRQTHRRTHIRTVSDSDDVSAQLLPRSGLQASTLQPAGW